MSQLEALLPEALLLKLDGALEAALGAAKGGPRGRPIVAFDADGTLWTGDVGDDLLEALLARRAVRPAAGAALREAARAHGVAESEDATAQAVLLYEGYRRGLVPDPIAFAMAAWIFAGHRADELYRFADDVLGACRIEERFHAEIAPVISWAQQRGVDVFVISASPTAVVEQAVGRLGVPRRNVLAMSPRYEEGLVVPDVVRPIPYAEGKVAMLDQAVPDALLIGAFGDNAFDIPLLQRATVAVAVRPKEPLLARAAEVPGMVELLSGPAHA
jgi:phosphatidylglycerophosphatase C